MLAVTSYLELRHHEVVPGNPAAARGHRASAFLISTHHYEANLHVGAFACRLPSLARATHPSLPCPPSAEVCAGAQFLSRSLCHMASHAAMRNIQMEDDRHQKHRQQRLEQTRGERQHPATRRRLSTATTNSTTTNHRTAPTRRPITPAEHPSCRAVSPLRRPHWRAAVGHRHLHLRLRRRHLHRRHRRPRLRRRRRCAAA